MNILQQKMDMKQFLINKFYYEKKLILLIVLTCMCCLCFGQVYYGKDEFGKIEFVNDTIALIAFINTNGAINNCQVYYYSNNDTIYLTTKIKEPFDIYFSKNQIPINIGGWCELTKLYFFSENILKLGIEGCYGYYDTISKITVFNDFLVKNNDIIVLQDGPYYVRLKIHTNNIEERYFAIRHNGDSFDDVVFFNKFPLLKKRNSLIPINKSLNNQCWVTNGFFFPKMKVSKKNRKFKTIPRWSKGLRGLPYWNDLNDVR